MSRRRHPPLFPVNVWPPFVDALTLVLAAFVVVIVLALVAQRGLLTRLRDRDGELTRLRDEKARIERRLQAIAPRGTIDIEGGKVILQGEVLRGVGQLGLNRISQASPDYLVRTSGIRCPGMPV